LVEPKVDRDNSHIPQGIERAEALVRRLGRRRFDFTPRQALHYNLHPEVIIAAFDREEYGAVLREIELHVTEWEGQQTPEQAEWVARARRRRDVSTGEAAKAIVTARRMSDQ
jgi:hypothetical protein